MSPNYSAIATFEFFYTPLLCLSGFAGNSLTVFIFCRTSLRKASSSYYLAALAVSDNVFLGGLFVLWLGGNLYGRPGVCHVINYLSGICSFLNVWLVVAFTVERYVAVAYPFLSSVVCTGRRARKVVAGLTFVSFLVSSPLLVFSTVVMENGVSVCTVEEDWTAAATLFDYVDFGVTFVVPVALVVFLNVSIGRALIRVSEARKVLTNGRLRVCERRCQISRNKVTKMLLVVSTVSICLNFPSHVMRILTYLIMLKVIKIEDKVMFLIIQHCCLQLFYTNFGVNFYLYCISGQNFRTALVGMFSNRARRGTGNFILSDSRTTTSTHSSSRCKTKGNMCVQVAVKAIPNQRRLIIDV